MTARLLHKVAVVTGGGSGFGQAIATRFAQEGASVVVADLDLERATSVADAIRGGGGQAIAQQVDVSRGAAVESLVNETLGAYGRLDIYVNNAGMAQTYAQGGDVSEEEFDRLFAVNTKSLYWCAVKAVPHMKARGGALISTASALALRPRPNMAWYCASKAALVTATKALALEVASSRIRVCCLCPTAADTPLLRASVAGLGSAQAQAGVMQTFKDSIPLGRLCEPEDIANAALFLASDEASFLTGVCLEVDGGRSI